MRYVPLALWVGAVIAGTTYFLLTPAAAPPQATAHISSHPPKLPSAPPATEIGLPISGLRVADIQDTFAQTRAGTRQHEAVDILAPRGTPVHSVVDGVVKKLFLSKPGGITLYQFDVRQEFSYYYAHLDRYAEGVKEGQLLRRGDVLGYVGSTGNANPNTPHLHMAIFALKPEKRWWQGTPVNPYPLLMKALQAESGI